MRRRAQGRGDRGRIPNGYPFSPTNISGLAAWYRADSLTGSASPDTFGSSLVSWFRADKLTGAAPNTISGCTGWFRADSLAALGNGASVATWTDGSGNGHDLSQAIGTQQPTFTASSASFNNQPCLHFNSAATQFLTSAAGWTLATDITVVVIGQDDGTHASYVGTANGGNWYLIGHLGKYSCAGAGFFDTTVSLSANTPRTFILAATAGNSDTWYVNGSLNNATGGAPGLATNSSGLVVGSSDALGSSVIGGDIAEVAVFNRALTQAEVFQIQTYAAKRYGISATLAVPSFADAAPGADATHALTQATQSAQPTLNLTDASYNNQATLSFASASTQFLQSGAWTAAIAMPETIVAIGNFSGAVAQEYFADGLVDNQRAVFNHSAGSGGSIYNGAFLDSAAPLNSSPRVLAGIFNGASSSVQVNSNLATVGNAGTGSATRTGLTIGASAVSHAGPLNGKIAEIAIFNRALSQSEIQSLEMYAAQRYGLTISIGQWLDQGGTGDANKNAAQATQSAQPTLSLSDDSYGGKPTIAFTAANCNLKSGAWAVAPPTTATVIVVGNDNNVVARAFIDGNTVNSYLIEDGGSGTSCAWGLNLYPTLALSGGRHLGNPNAIVAIFNGASSSEYVSAQTPLGTGQNVGTSAPTLITIGNKADNTGLLNGKIAELIIYSRVLSQNEINQILNYCGGRYGITIGA